MLRRIFLSLALFTTVTGASYAQKIAITKGQKLETVTSTTATTEAMGQSFTMETSETKGIEVKDVTAEGFVFSTITKRMTMKGNVMGQDLNFDSDKKEDMDGQIGQQVKDQIGAQQELQVDKKGKITGTDADGKKAGGGMSDLMNVSGGLLKGQPYPLLIQLPSSSLKTGSVWIDSSGTLASLKTVTTYTLKAITEDGVLVSYTSKVARSGPMTQNGMEMQIDMAGEVKGDAIYDAATGILKKNTNSTDIKGTVAVMGQNAPITVTSNTTIVTKKI